MSAPRTCRRSLASSNSFLRAYFSTSRVLAREDWVNFQRQNRIKKPHSQLDPSANNPLRGLDPSERQEKSKNFLKDLTVTDYNVYGDTEPPTKHQLHCANQFFVPSRHSPHHLWSSSYFRTIPPSEQPEVAFIGRSNAGKSSLINALVGKDICRVSTTLGFTKAFHAHGIGGKTQFGSKFALVDFPGYGKGSAPQWGEEFLKYVERRKQLRRVFVLVDASTGLKPSDIQALQLLGQHPISYQIILNKIDKLILQGKMNTRRGFHEGRLLYLDRQHDNISRRLSKELPPSPGLLKDLLACNAKASRKDVISLGVDAVRWAVVRAAGLEQHVAPDSDSAQPAQQVVTSSAS